MPLVAFSVRLDFGEIAGRSAEVGIPSQSRPTVLPSVAAVVAEGARKLIELAGTGYKAAPGLDSDGGYPL